MMLRDDYFDVNQEIIQVKWTLELMLNIQLITAAYAIDVPF
jgi:hypothetical protein